MSTINQAADPQDMNTVNMQVDMTDATSEHLEQLTQLNAFIDRLETTGTLDKDIAFESSAIFTGNEILRAYYSPLDAQKKFNSAMESFTDKVAETAMRVFEALKKAIIRLKDWLMGKLKGKDEDKSKIMEAGNQAKLQKLLSDPEFDRIDAILKTAQKAGLEDYRPVEANSRLAKMFEGYKQTLSDMEVDFLTSGTYYRNIQVLVKDWNEGHYSEFVSTLRGDIDAWTDEGLDKTKHVGKDSRVVREFRDTMQASANTLFAKHSRKLSAIRYMEETHQNTRTAGNVHRLHEFLTKPSSLFPHISNLWKTIHFESMTTDDQELIKSLDKVETYFDARIKMMRERASVDKVLWPAEDAFLQLCAKINQDALKAITILVRISDIIRKSAICALNATNKSFTYIRHLLQQIKASASANVEEVERCIQAIDTRHKELEQLVSY